MYNDCAPMGKFKICASEINQNGTMVLGRYKICPHNGCNMTSDNETNFDNTTTSTIISTTTTSSIITTIYHGTPRSCDRLSSVLLKHSLTQNSSPQVLVIECKIFKSLS